MLFYLGTHEPSWLARAGVPLFVSDRRLRRRRSMPRAVERWALDSGGFTELSMHGRWVTTAREYADRARRYATEIGRLDWAAPQDWMCEPSIREQTGQTVADHQRRTIDSYLELCALAPEVNWAPVLQGWVLRDYLDHIEQYRDAGIDLAALPIVGVGTVCRRQGTAEGVAIIKAIARQGIALHAYGFKKVGLARCCGALCSADSMAWSFGARRSPPLPGCTHKSCANCLRYALRWRRQLIEKASRPPAQLGLFA